MATLFVQKISNMICYHSISLLERRNLKLFKFINNIKFKAKLNVFVALIFSLIILVSAILLYNAYLGKQDDLEFIDQTIRNNYDRNIKDQVDNVITLLDGIYEKYDSGELTFAEAQTLGADLVRDLRYDGEGYFWIDTIDGVNVVLLGSDTEGTNRYNFFDSNGVPVVKKCIKIALESESGYIDYWFPKANQTQPVMKRGYVKLFVPFNWVVGTGNYIDDINKSIEDKRKDIDTAFQNQIFAISVLFLLLIIGTISLVSFFAKSITIPLQKTTHLANLISNGVLDEHIDNNIKKRKDEIGQLATSIEKMRNSIKQLIDALTENAKMLELEKELFGTTLKSIGDAVISTDQNENIVLMNTVSEELTGWKQEEASGKPFEEVFKIINEYTREKCVNPVTKALQLKKVVSLENHAVLITKNGDGIPIEDRASPITDMNGNIIGAVLVFRDVTDQKEKQKKIEYLSYHDQLTGLFNRHFFAEEIKRLDVDRNLPFTIAMVDVNGLKLTNDAFGHEVGDLLLQSVAKVLKSECRAEDIVSRIGGDEFVILLPRTSSVEAELIIKRIYKAMELQKVDNVVISVSIGWETKESSHDDIREVFAKAEDFMYRKKITESQSMRNQTIKVIMHTLHEANAREKIHSERVSKLCRKIGEAMKLDNEVIKELELAGLMHDIGKIAINNDILNKPGKLTEAEYEEVKKHPEISYHILKSADVYTRLAEYVLSHHERWDGKGYPRGLSGEDIPLVSRIITVADAYEAMTAIRTYKGAFSHEQAIEELKRCSGTQFDPEIVHACQKYCWTRKGEF